MPLGKNAMDLKGRACVVVPQHVREKNKTKNIPFTKDIS